MKKLQLTKETLANLSTGDQAQFLQGVNGGMAAPPSNGGGSDALTCRCSVSVVGPCSALICFPTTDCSIRGCA